VGRGSVWQALDPFEILRMRLSIWQGKRLSVDEGEGRLERAWGEKVTQEGFQ
jgi:hypothetical protein